MAKVSEWWSSLTPRARLWIVILVLCLVSWAITAVSERMGWDAAQEARPPAVSVDAQTGLPEAYSGSPVVEIDGNEPSFAYAELQSAVTGYEDYSPLDSLGRCGAATAVVGPETVPADGEERGSISSVKPSGWNNAKYTFVDGTYLYNRCHLIGWQLTAENGNERNLVTGTRYMNVEGMLPYENEVAYYVRTTGNHVLYRVTPVFSGDELVCRGVYMEAQSIEDDGVSFHVFAYNVQPGVEIDYSDGSSHADGTVAA